MVATKHRTPGKRRLAQGLRRQLEAAKRDRNPRVFFENVRESFTLGHLGLEDISLRALFEEIIPQGREIVQAWECNDFQELSYIQEMDAVNTADFVKILTLAVSGTVLGDWELPDLLQDRIARVRTTNLDRERITGIGEIGDKAKEVAEGQPYPLAGVGPNWMDTPVTKKRGMIVPVTKEAIFFDRTGQLRDKCSQVVKWMRVNKEKRLIALLIGNVNNYNWNGTSYSTYQNGGANELFDNTIAGNPFVNHKSLQSVITQRSKLRSPDTNEPLDLGVNRLVLGPPELEPEFQRVFGAKEIRQTDGSTVTIGSNPAGGYNWVTSPYIRDLQGNSTDWYVGDPAAAFLYLQNWGITPETAGRGSEMDFTNDIVLRFKVSERAAEFVEEPRHMTKSTA